MENSKIDTFNFLGITRKSNISSVDGECMEIINLRKNGKNLHVIKDKKRDQYINTQDKDSRIDDITYIFKHKCTPVNSIIYSTVQTTGSWVYYVYNNLKTKILTIRDDENIIEFNELGNILIIITTKNNYYLLYNNNVYSKIDKITPPKLEIYEKLDGNLMNCRKYYPTINGHFGEFGENRAIDLWINFHDGIRRMGTKATAHFWGKYDKSTSHISTKGFSHVFIRDVIFGDTIVAKTRNETIDKDKKQILKPTLNLLKKIIADKRKDGLFNGHAFMRVAFRMYDNSFCGYSKILYKYIGTSNSNCVSEDCFVRNVQFGDLILDDLNNYGEKLKTENIECLYKNNAMGQLHCVHVSDTGAEAYDRSGYTIVGFGVSYPELYYYFSEKQIKQIKNFIDNGIIQSMCVFMTDPIASEDLENGFEYIKSEDITYLDKMQDIVKHIYGFKQKDKELFTEESLLNQPFYLVKEIKLKELDLNSGMKKIDIILDKGKLDIINTFEILPTDNFTANDINANSSFVYNDRLHLMNITTKLFTGYSPTHELDLTYQIGNKTFKSGLIISQSNELDLMKLNYGRSIGTAYLFVDFVIKQDIINKVIRMPLNYCATSSYNGDKYNNIIVQPFACYPDIRCSEIFIIAKITDVTGIENTRVLHKFKCSNCVLQNVSLINSKNIEKYEIGDNIIYRDIFIQNGKFINGEIYETDIQIDNAIINDTNRLQVSEQNNPFIFPAKNSYRFGDANTQCLACEITYDQMSEGLFGMYPLYVFTTTGIYALEAGNNEILYAKISNINADRILHKNSIVSCNGLISYMANNSIKIISGKNSISISDEITEHAFNSINLDKNYTDLLCVAGGCTSNKEFVEEVKNSLFFYDSLNSELCIINSDAIGYIYNFKYKVWTKIWYQQFGGGKVFSVLKNNTTQILATKMGFVSTGILNITTYDINQEVNSMFPILIQTNPIKLNSLSYKRIEKIILRLYAKNSTINNDYGTNIYIYGSTNCMQWILLGRGYAKKDIVEEMEMRRLSCSMIYYIFVISSNACMSESVFNQIDIEYKTRYNNKLR